MCGLIACTGDDELSSSTDAVSIDAVAYSAVVSVFLPPSSGEPRPVVWIAHLGADPLPLDQQVGMIAEVEATHDLRFVDDAEAAVGDGGEAPREDGLLLGLGEIRAEPPHTVRVEVFLDDDRVRAELVTLERVGDVWTIESREVVEPEDLVLDE